MKLEIHKRYQRAVRLAYVGVFLVALLLSVASYLVNRNELIENHSLGINDYANTASQTLEQATQAIQGMGDFVRDQATQSQSFDVSSLIAGYRIDHLNELYTQTTDSEYRLRTGNRFGRLIGSGDLLGREQSFYRELGIAKQLDAAFGLFQRSYPSVGVMYYCSEANFIKLFPWQEAYRSTVEDALQDNKVIGIGDGETLWGTPKVSLLLNELVVKLRHGVSVGHQLNSSLSMEMPLDLLTQKLKAQQALPGTAMMIDEASGFVLAHERLVKQNVKTLYRWHLGLPEALNHLTLDDLKRLREGQVLEGYHVQTRNMGAAPWMLVYVTDTDELLASARMTFAGNLLMILVVLSAIVAILNRATRSTFLKPATQLVDQIYRCAAEQPDTNGPYPKGWENWFRLVYDTFSEKRDLIEAKELQNQQLDQLVQERTKQLQQSEMRTQLTLEAVSDGLFDYRTDEVTFFASDRFWTMIGYQPGEYPSIMERWFDLLHPDHRSHVEKAITQIVSGRGKLIEQVQKTGSFQMEYKLRTKQQDYRWIRARGSVVEWSEDGLPLRIVGIQSDITDAKRAEKVRLRQLQILNASPDLIASFDQDGLFEYANEAVRSLCGIESGQEREHHIGELLDSQVIEVEVLPDALQKGYASCEMELKVGHRSLPVSLTLVAHKQRGSSRKRYSFIARDVSERKAFEQSLLKSKQEAELASQYKSEFLANMSHEIRTPMNAVMGMLRLVNATELTDEQRDYLRKANFSAESLLEIINDILDFSKIEAGKLELEAIPFNLEEVVELAISHIAVRAEQKGLLLLTRIDPHVPRHLLGDPVRLGQVLSNLLSNAVKFTEQGQVTLNIELASEQLERAHLRLSVEDTGIGIDALQQSKLFDAFSQADGSTTRKYGGTGLGLSICQHLVKQMQGDITVDSSPDQGSRFTIQLSLPRSTVEDNLVCGAHRGQALLILNSNERTVLLKEQLEYLGIEVQSVAPGAKLGNLLEQQRFRYLMLDSSLLPDYQSQLGVAKAGGRLEFVLAIRGYDVENISIGEQYTEAVDGFLTKPVLLSRLASQLLALESDNTQEKTDRDECTQLSGKQILVVEDNPINQEVAMRLLEKQDMVVSIADNGIEALEAVQSNRFDAVLMDIQMPEMDGLEATRQIRALPGFTDLPIIAMTAHAMAGDREKSLMAGMNDHLTKPIDPQELYGVLANFILSHGSTRSQPKEQAPVEPAPDKATASADDYESGLDEEFGEQQCGDDRAAYLSLLSQFANRYAGMREEIEALQTNEQPELLKKQLHTLKGVAGNLGARKLWALCQQWQQAPQKPLLTAIQSELQAVLQAIAALLEQEREESSVTEDAIGTEVVAEDVQSEAPPSEAEVGSLLMELESRLVANDYVEDEFIAPLARHMNHVEIADPDLEGTYREMSEALEEMDYDSALASLSILSEKIDLSSAEQTSEDEDEPS